MSDENLGPQLEQLLKLAQEGPARDPQAALVGRTRFLEQARQAKLEFRSAPVSTPLGNRHIRWKLFFSRRELKPMSILATVFLIVSLLAGGTGVTVAAAQGSGPGEALYAVKLAGEDVRYALATQEQTRLSLALQFANERSEEVVECLRAGAPVPEPVVARWENQLQTALRLAAGMQDGEMNRALGQVQTQVKSQIQQMAQFDNGSNSATLRRLRTMLQNQTSLVEKGFKDPETFRQRMRGGPIEEPPGPGNCDGCTPTGAGGQGGNPYTTGTPTPGSGYGPGPGDCEGCTPTGSGGDPWTATPGNSCGPGPQPTIQGTQPGPGPQPTVQGTQPGPGPQPTTQPTNGQSDPGNGNEGGGGRP
jgi:hypothetical protein